MRCKKGNDRTSRGYCGWYTNRQGNKVYLRSKLEYIIAKWLDIKKIKFLTESHVYYINDSTYKPDFFIFNKNGNLIKIIEVKYTNDERIDYIKKYKKFFNNIGISYFVFNKYHINSIMKKYNIKKDVDYWCLNSANIQHDMYGNKNPHFNILHSEKTKRLIGKKTKERFNVKSFKEKHHLAMLKSMTDEKKKHLSNIKTGKPIRLVDKVQIKTKCLFCDGDVKGIEWYKNDILMKREIKKFCSNKCKCRYTKKNEINIKREEQIKIMKNYYIKNNKFLNRKDFSLYCKENGVKCDIRSTFNTHKKFIEYMKEVVNG